MLAKKRLSPAEWAVLCVLCENAQYRSGKVAHKNGRAFKTEWLAEQADVAVKTLRRALKHLEIEGFIALECKNLYLNPYFLHKGGVIPKEIVELFSETEFAKAAGAQGGK